MTAPVFVISLKDQTDRRRSVASELAQHGIAFEFFDAVDGRAGISNPRAPFPLITAAGRYGLSRSPTEMACFASHVLLWRRCVELQRPITILEDDVRLAPDAGEAWRRAGTHVGDDLVRLSGMATSSAIVLDRVTEELRLVQFLRGPLGAEAYVIGPGGARKLLAHAAPTLDPVDEYIDRFWVHDVRPLGLTPWRIRQQDVGSSITRAALPTGFGWARYKLGRQIDSQRRKRWLRHNLPRAPGDAITVDGATPQAVSRPK